MCVCVVCDLQVCVHESVCIFVNVFVLCVTVYMWYVNVWCANVCVHYYRGLH